MKPADSGARPTAGQERWLTVARRYRGLLRSPVGLERTGPWRSKSLAVRGALFVMGLLVAVCVTGILVLSGTPGSVLLSGVLLVAAAEWLVWQQRMYWGGMEESLCASGLVLVALDLSGALHGGRDGVLAWLVCAALALAGLRMLNALLTTLAAVMAVVAVYTDIGALLPGSLPAWVNREVIASLLCFTAALVALAAGGLRHVRPAHDRMLDGLVCCLPVVGYLCFVHLGWSSTTIDYRHARTLYEFYVPVALLVTGGVALVAGIRRRTHAPLIAAMACCACLGIELRNSSGLALETRLVLEGCLLMAACIALSRWLRTPRNGIGAQPPGRDESALDAIQQGGAAALGATHMQPVEPGFKGGGGTFGGGGASGKF